MIRPGVVGLLALAILSSPAASEPALDSVTVEARLAKREPATVEMTYYLRPAGASSVLFTSIRFGDARAANVRAFLEEHEVSFRVAEEPATRVDGQVELPPRLADRDRIRLRLAYEVLPASDPDDGTIALPLLVVRWPPAETRPRTFRAAVHLPAGLFLRSAFPTSFERADSVDRTSSDNVYGFELPVVPALLRLDVSAREPRFLTAVTALDLAAFGLLLALALFGIKRMRETLR